MKHREKVDVFDALGKVFQYMRQYKVIVVFALIMAALGAVLTIVGPNKIGEMTDLMRDGLFGEIDMAAIGRIGITMLAIYLCSALFTFLQHYIMATVTLKTSKRMRGDLSEKINRVPQSYFNTTTQGDILSRITNDVQTLQQGLSNSLPNMISAIAQFFGALIMMFYTEWADPLRHRRDRFGSGAAYGDHA